MINYKTVKSVIDIKICFSKLGFSTCVQYTEEALENAPECTNNVRDDLGFTFPVYALSKLQFSFDGTLAGWQFDLNPVRFKTFPGEEFSAPIPLLENGDRNFDFPAIKLALINYFLKPGNYVFDLHMLDPAGNKIIIDPTVSHHHP